MFTCNVSLNKTKFIKVFLGIVIIVLLIFLLYAAYRIYSESLSLTVKDSIPKSDVINIDSSNCTNILKTVHDDLNTYVGKKIHFSGYIYRVSDFRTNQFVLARDMIISSNLQTLVVGFLCENKETVSFEDNTWVEVTGTITKGKYYEEVPVIQITEIKKIEKPKDSYVYPPDETFIPTVNLF